MTKDELIAHLQLEQHVEGGWFRRIYTAQPTVATADGERAAMSSIHYLLTDDYPRGHLHRNRSDILHYWQFGGALQYWLINPAGELHSHVLGPDLSAGQQLFLCVPGGWWKASELLTGANNAMNYGLVSEAVCPGFDFADHEMGDVDTLSTQHPQLRDTLRRLCRPQ